MVLNCVAYDCRSLHNRGCNISFHNFPHKNLPLLNLWINAVRRENWKPSQTSRLCSLHFKEEDYEDKPGGSYLKRLKKDAVPSIFNYSSGSSEKTKSPRRILKRVLEDSNQEFISEKTNVDFELPVIQTTHVDASIQCCIQDPQKTLEMKLKIRTLPLQQKLRRQNRKIVRMKQRIKFLEEHVSDLPEVIYVVEEVAKT